MFGWSSRAATSSKGSKARQERFEYTSDSFGIGLDVGEEYTDADLNDPDLLRQLQALTVSEDSKAKPAPKPAPRHNTIANRQPDIDWSTVNALLDGGIEKDIGDVVLTEADENDPDLLEQLKLLQENMKLGEEEILNVEANEEKNLKMEKPSEKLIEEKVHAEEKEIVKKPDIPKDLISFSSVAEKTPPPVTKPPETLTDIEDVLQCTDPDVLAHHIQMERTNAVLKKRGGDREGALTAMRNYKRMQAQLEKLLDNSDHVETNHSKASSEEKANKESSSGPTVDVPQNLTTQTLVDTQISSSTTSDLLSSLVSTQDATSEPMMAAFSPPPKPEQQHVLSSMTSLDNLPEKAASASGTSQTFEVTSSAKFDSAGLDELTTLQTRQNQYKKAAVHFKRLGNIVRAKQMLSISKSITVAISQLESIGTLPHDFVVPDEPQLDSLSDPSDITPPNDLPASPSSMSPSQLPPTLATDPTESESKRLKTEPQGPTETSGLGNGKTEEGIEGIRNDNVLVFEPSTLSREEQYAKLILQLEEQVKSCLSVAGHYLRCGQRQQAVSFNRLKKVFEADLQSLISHRDHGRPVPAFHYHSICYEVQNTFPDIDMGQVEVEVIRGVELGSREVPGRETEAYVVFDFGWPPEGNPGYGQGKETSSVAKRGPNPEFSVKKRIPIDRNKAFQRHLERKKATFEVFHYRGFFRKAVSLGRAQCTLSPLLRQCEIHEVVELLDNNKRPTGGRLEIRICLRTPLLGTEILRKTDKWLVIDEFNPANPIPPEISLIPPASSQSPGMATGATTSRENPTSKPSTPVSTPSKNSARTGSASQLLTSPSGFNSSPIPSAPSTPLPARRLAETATPTKSSPAKSAPSQELESALAEFYNPDTIASNNVLEHEIGLISSKLAAMDSGSAEYEDQLDRKQALEVKMNLLVLQVQMGQLTMEAYLDQVRVAAGKARRLALLLKKHNKIEEAKQSLRRAKIMEEEVEEAEKAIAGGVVGGENLDELTAAD
ncbi:uncharacterized protein VTP21DRAFT_1135 [Calcarisporiella thermophila]|uniref:uncharacterized protein n=1 Tax=Calcarisporiella thermophila TaxID=911321 RepID=UPI0037437492